MPTEPDTDDPAYSPAGFPLNTAIRDMSDLERGSYWRSHCRKHEQRAGTYRAGMLVALDLLQHGHPSEAAGVIERQLYPTGDPITFTVNR